MLSGALESSFPVSDGDLKMSDENTDSAQASQEPRTSRAQQEQDTSVKVVVDDVEGRVDSVKADDDDDDDGDRDRLMRVKDVTCKSARTVLDQSTL